MQCNVVWQDIVNILYVETYLIVCQRLLDTIMPLKQGIIAWLASYIRE